MSRNSFLDAEALSSEAPASVFSDDDFVQVEYRSQESFVEVGSSDDEVSLDSRCVEQVSVGSCVLLGGGGKDSKAVPSAASRSDEIVSLSGNSISFEKGQVSPSVETLNGGENDDNESDVSSISTFTLDHTLGICTNSPDINHDEKIKIAAELTSVPVSAARAILEHYNWDMNELCEKYFSEEERVWSSCGVLNECMAHRSRRRASDYEEYRTGVNFCACLDCGERSHAPLTCAQLAKWRRKCSEEEGSIRWILQNTTKCPMCKNRMASEIERVSCDRYGFVFPPGWSGGTAESVQTLPQTQMDANEFFIHCVDKFKSHEKNENLMEKLLRVHCSSSNIAVAQANKPSDRATTHFIQAIDQLVECHRVLKLSCVALYFSGSSTSNGLIEHRRNLLESLAEDLREVVLNESIGRPELLVNRTAAVKRFVSNLLDDLELQSDGSLEPPCNDSTETPASGDIDKGAVRWCLHPGCPESVERFATDSDVKLHYTTVHNGNFQNSSILETKGTASAKGPAPTPLPVSDAQEREHVSKREEEERAKFSERRDNCPGLPCNDSAADLSNLRRWMLAAFAEPAATPPVSRLRFELGASMRRAADAAEIESDSARRRLANLGLPRSLDAYNAIRETGGELPPRLWRAIEQIQSMDEVGILRQKLRALEGWASISRSRFVDLAGLLNDYTEESIQVLSILSPLRERLSKLEGRLQEGQDGDRKLFDILNNFESEPAFWLLQCTREELQRMMPAGRKEPGGTDSVVEDKGIDTAPLESALADLDDLLGERKSLTEELRAKADAFELAPTPVVSAKTESPPEAAGSTEFRRRLEETVDAALRPLGSGLGELGRLGARQSIVLREIEEENATFRDALDRDTRAGMEHLQKLEDALMTLVGLQKQVQEGRDFYLVILRKLEQLKREESELRRKLELE